MIIIILQEIFYKAVAKILVLFSCILSSYKYFGLKLSQSSLILNVHTPFLKNRYILIE